MARRVIEFQTIRSEGGLLPPDLLRRVLDPKAKLDGTRPEDYGLPQSERLNEVITQSWNRLRKHWAEFCSAAASLADGEAGTGLTNDKWTLPLLRELDFGPLPTTPARQIADRAYAISRFLGPVPVHLVGCGVSLDRRTAGVRGAASANPHGLVQEFLNRCPDSLWAIVSNGLILRILRDNQALSRQSYLEFDLETMFSGEVYSDFVLLWMTAHASRFTPREGERPDTCWLEQWTKLAEEQGTRALGDLRGGVEKALQILGEGFTSHPKNTVLRDALRTRQITPSDLHGQLLRVIYRLIFLFVAEDRILDGLPLLHPRDESDSARLARERYAAHYSTARFRDLASKIKGSRHGDLWRQFQLLANALSGDKKYKTIRENLDLPALGSFLWNPANTASLNDAQLTNHDFLECLRNLAFTRQGKVLRPVDYQNLGAEELGGVYESLLALTPQLSADGARFTFAEFAGSERKTSGSYYTPDSLVQCLLDSALDPVVEEAIRGKTGSEAEKAILALKVCDPAVGSGHFLVGAAHRLARHLARVRAHSQGESEPSPLLYQHALRDVIGHCLYGVDINPMAAELCRVSLWLEALEPGKPLSFLDHHIRVGNSLLGTTPELLAKGIPDEAFNPIEGDDRKYAATLKKLNKTERNQMSLPLVAEEEAAYGDLADRVINLDSMDDDSIESVSKKENSYNRLNASAEYRDAKLPADAWCAAFLWKKHRDSAAAITEDILRRMQNGPSNIPAQIIAEIDRLSRQYQFFHWHLSFPEIFAEGGFSCVLGNPPWVSLTGRFSSEEADQRSKQLGIFRHRCNTYMPNTYEMFVRLALEIVQKSGFVALLLPDRFAFNVYLQPLREKILSDTSIATLVFKVPFPNVTVDVLAFVTRSSEPTENHEIQIREWGGDTLLHSQTAMLKHPVCAFEFYTSSVDRCLMEQIESHPRVRRLDKLCDITSGFGGKSQKITREHKIHTQIEVLKGESICRFGIKCSFWFEFIRENITGRTTDRHKLGAIPKILLRKTGDSLIATLDCSGRFPEQSLYFLFNFASAIEPKYLLGILNSRLINFYFKKRCLTNPDSIAQVKKTDLDTLPIRIPNLDCNAEVEEQHEIISSVAELLANKGGEDDPAFNAMHERVINDAVYRLYELTDEQVGIVEAFFESQQG